jgi:hypothetical protein
MIGGGKTGWSAAHNQHIHFKDFAFLHSGRIAEMNLYRAAL